MKASCSTLSLDPKGGLGNPNKGAYILSSTHFGSFLNQGPFWGSSLFAKNKGAVPYWGARLEDFFRNYGIMATFYS